MNESNKKNIAEEKVLLARMVKDFGLYSAQDVFEQHLEKEEFLHLCGAGGDMFAFWHRRTYDAHKRAGDFARTGKYCLRAGDLSGEASLSCHSRRQSAQCLRYTA